jgi:hypothetical protein
LDTNNIEFLPSCIGRIKKLNFSYSNNCIRKITPNTANVLLQNNDTTTCIDDTMCIPEEIQEKIFNIMDASNAIINLMYIEQDIREYIDYRNKKIVMKYCEEKKLYNNTQYELNILFYEIFQIALSKIKENDSEIKNQLVNLLNKKIENFDNMNHTERLLSLIELFE